MLMKKNPAKILKVTNISADDFWAKHIHLYSPVANGTFYDSEKFRKRVSKNETAMLSVSDRNPESLDTFREFRNEKSSKIKTSSHSVYSLEPENMSNAIGLRNKQDTPTVAYTLRDSTADQPGCSL